MNEKVTPINATVANPLDEANAMSEQVVKAMERMLEMAKSGELTGVIGILQLRTGEIGQVSAGGGACHPYTTLGALEALTQHHKLAIMQHVELRPAFEERHDAPKQS